MVTQQDKKIMEAALAEVNPAAVQRQIQALTSELLTLTTSKAAARNKPQIQPTTTRASVHESTKRGLHAHLDVSHRGYHLPVVWWKTMLHTVSRAVLALAGAGRVRGRRSA